MGLHRRFGFVHRPWHFFRVRLADSGPVVLWRDYLAVFRDRHGVFEGFTYSGNHVEHTEGEVATDHHGRMIGDKSQSIGGKGYHTVGNVVIGGHINVQSTLVNHRVRAPFT